MNVLVLYQSRHGHTRAAAETAAQAVRAQGHAVSLKSVIEVGSADVQRADLLFVGTWVQGFILFGVRPAGADLWVSALPPLEGKPVGVFCTYAVHPHNSLRVLSTMLTARGGRVVGEQAFRRGRLGQAIEAFAREVLQKAMG